MTMGGTPLGCRPFVSFHVSIPGYAKQGIRRREAVYASIGAIFSSYAVSALSIVAHMSK